MAELKSSALKVSGRTRSVQQATALVSREQDDLTCGHAARLGQVVFFVALQFHWTCQGHSSSA